MKTVSTIKPLSKFKIEMLSNNQCVILFFDNIDHRTDGMYEFDMYRLNATYRKGFEALIEERYEQWLNKAKEQEVSNNTSVQVTSVEDKVDMDKLDLTAQLFVMEHRMMQMERQNAVGRNIEDNYNKSPYTKAKVLIENKYLDGEYMLSLLDDFVNSKYMTVEEYSDLYDLLDKVYNKL